MADDSRSQSTRRGQGAEQAASETFFRADEIARRLPEAWALLNRMVGGGLALDRLYLVRWNRLRDFLGQDWAPFEPPFLAALRQVIESETGDAICLPFDGDGLLVVIGDRAEPLSGALATAVRESLGDTWPVPSDDSLARDALQIWPIQTVSADGLSCRRPISPPASRQNQPNASQKVSGSPASRLVLADADFTFFPIWDVAKNHTLGHLCRPLWRGPGGRPLDEGSSPFSETAPEQIAAIDITIFDAAIRLVQNALDHYGAINVIVPIHATLFADREAIEAYFKVVNQQIWPFVENVMFEVLCGYRPLDDAMLAEMERFSDYGRLPMVRLPAPQAIDEAGSLGAIWSLGFDFAPCAESADVDTLFDTFHQRAADIGCRCHVIGLTDPTTTVAAIGAGFEFVGSDAIAPPLASQDDAGPETDPTDILKSILAAKAQR